MSDTVTLVLSEEEAVVLRYLIGKTKSNDFREELWPIFKELCSLAPQGTSIRGERSANWKCPEVAPDVE